MEDGVGSVGIATHLHPRLDELGAQRAFRNLQLEPVERHAIVVAERSLPISWGMVTIFGLAVVAGLAVFGARYADSRIHAWDDVRPLREEFLASRLTAHERGCVHQPCFAVGPRVDGAGKPLPSVNEYILYLTDGALLAAALLVMLGLAYMLFVGLQKTRTPRFEL
ncbi:MAG: hypothetical protein HYS63_07660 [Methylocystis sp.]|nr:hypothetical protein [Methylocystis sp.]